MTRHNRNLLSALFFASSAMIIVVVALRARHETAVQLKATRTVNDVIQAVLDSIDYGYAIIDEQGNLIEWNPAMERLTGWKFSELKGDGLRSIMNDETWARHWAAFQQAMASADAGKHVAVVRCEIPSHSNEHSMPVRVTVRIVEDRHGKRFAVAHIDPTENVKVTRISNSG